jgi:hypothetical protein
MLMTFASTGLHTITEQPVDGGLETVDKDLDEWQLAEGTSGSD